MSQLKIKIHKEEINAINTQPDGLRWELVNMMAQGEKGEKEGDFQIFTDPNGTLTWFMTYETFVVLTQLMAVGRAVVENLPIYLEMPLTDFENNQVTEGLPSRTYIDENETEQVHTWKTWSSNRAEGSDGVGGTTYKVNIAGNKVVFPARPKGQNWLSNVQFLPIAGIISGGADIIPHTLSSRKSINQDPLWTIAEE